MHRQTAVAVLLMMLVLPVLALQDDQKYAGTWSGTFKSESGGSGQLSYTFKKDDKGAWQGSIKYTNDAGTQSADLKDLTIANGHFKAKMDPPDGQVQVMLDGDFKGNQLDGTYVVMPKDSSDPVEKGTWTTTKA
jgi:hypothetical protein